MRAGIVQVLCKIKNSEYKYTENSHKHKTCGNFYLLSHRNAVKFINKFLFQVVA